MILSNFAKLFTAKINSLLFIQSNVSGTYSYENQTSFSTKILV